MYLRDCDLSTNYLPRVGNVDLATTVILFSIDLELDGLTVEM